MPDAQPSPISDPEMEGTHYGIAVTPVGDEGGMLALGHHEPRRALAAFNRHARVYTGPINLFDDRSTAYTDVLGDIRQQWGAFRAPDPNRDEDPDYTWVVDYCGPDTPGALPVTVLET